MQWQSSPCVPRGQKSKPPARVVPAAATAVGLWPVTHPQRWVRAAGRLRWWQGGGSRGEQSGVPSRWLGRQGQVVAPASSRLLLKLGSPCAVTPGSLHPPQGYGEGRARARQDFHLFLLQPAEWWWFCGITAGACP